MAGFADRLQVLFVVLPALGLGLDVVDLGGLTQHTPSLAGLTQVGIPDQDLLTQALPLVAIPTTGCRPAAVIPAVAAPRFGLGKQVAIVGYSHWHRLSGI